LPKLHRGLRGLGLKRFQGLWLQGFKVEARRIFNLERLEKISTFINLHQLLSTILMTIQQAQQTVDEWVNSIGVRYYGELTNMAILSEEVGEVARLMARLYGEQSFKTPEQATSAEADLADEMADVLFVLICLANQTGVNLTEAFRKNLEKKTIRDAARHAGNEKLK
jgi:NTP pyrophosphatase (non-canonical NTP hydrolase)